MWPEQGMILPSLMSYSLGILPKLEILSRFHDCKVQKLPFSAKISWHFFHPPV
jgi:hypothetical protein